VLGEEYKEKLSQAKNELAIKKELNTPEVKSKMKPKLKLKKGK
jgi:hypothetical protein